jgi:hypothetical protein
METVASLAEMPEAGPWKMVDDRQHPLAGKHVHRLQSRFDAELSIRIVTITGVSFTGRTISGDDY